MGTNVRMPDFSRVLCARSGDFRQSTVARVKAGSLIPILGATSLALAALTILLALWKVTGEAAMGSSILTGLAFLLFAVGGLIYTVILYNGLVRLRNENDRAWANIDVLLKQRHDEIPNLVETVKGYMQHEQQTLLAVTQARAASVNAAR